MRKVWILAIAALLTGCATKEVAKAPENNLVLTEIPEVSAYALARPIHDKNLTVIPVVAKNKMPIQDDMATLAEAKKNGWIEIIEVPGQEQVERLQVRNTGPKPILLLAGELLLGGKQDRVVSKDTVIPTNETVSVPVYCVEPGRWESGPVAFEAADAQVPALVREKAMYGNQDDVWAEVGDFNAMAGGSGGGTTVQRGLKTETVTRRIESSNPVLLKALTSNEKAVGAIFVVNGRLRTMELFGNHNLFSSSIESILKGYLSEAAVTGETSAKQFLLEDAVAFMRESLAGTRKLTSAGTLSNGFSIESDSAVGREIATQDYEAKPSEDGSIGILHGTYKKK